MKNKGIPGEMPIQLTVDNFSCFSTIANIRGAQIPEFNAILFKYSYPT
jgi:hypothetical protein